MHFILLWQTAAFYTLQDLNEVDYGLIYVNHWKLHLNGLQAGFCQFGFLWYLRWQIKIRKEMKLIPNVQCVVYTKEGGISWEWTVRNLWLWSSGGRSCRQKARVVFQKQVVMTETEDHRRLWYVPVQVTWRDNGKLLARPSVWSRSGNNATKALLLMELCAFRPCFIWFLESSVNPMEHIWTLHTRIGIREWLS